MAPDLGPGESTTATVTYATGSSNGPGTLKLKVLYASNNATGIMNFTVAAPEAPTVVRRNRPDQLERSLCLTTGAGEAAVQCGDLIVAHAMPAYRTLGRDRTFTLVYNSGTARPMPTLALAVNPGAVKPTSIDVTWKVGPAGSLPVNQTTVATANYSTSNWSANQAKQIVLQYDAVAALQATGVYDYTVEVKSNFASGPLGTTQTGSLIVVNRSGSRFGKGWHPAGLEWIGFQGPEPQASRRLLWVGGDGSARIYAPLGDGTHWVAPAAAFRDTITLSGSTFTRRLRHGVQVQYNACGMHTKTIARTTQETSFSYSSTCAPSDRLTGITVPPAGTGGSYVLAYDGNNNLDTVTDPAGRVLDVNIFATQLLMGIADPDGLGVSFSYDPATARLTQRRNRLSYITYFWYTNGRVTSVDVPYGPTGLDTATTRYEPWQAKGLATGTTGQTAVDTSQVAAVVRGPRANVADDATIRVDSWGAPSASTNALGETTQYQRGDASHPALVTKVIYPTGRVVNMTYNARGNLTYLEDLTAGLAYAGLQIGTPNKSTTWTYGDTSTPDSPSRVTDALGRHADYTYNALGLTDMVTDSRQHKTIYTYNLTGALTGLLTKVTEKSVMTWREQTGTETATDLATTIAYDATKGNVSRITSPLGVATSFTNNTVGLPQDTYDPMSVKSTTYFDKLNRDTLTIEYLAQATPPQGNPLAACDAGAISCSNVLQKGVDSLAPSAERRTRMVQTKWGLDSVIDPRGVVRSYLTEARGLVRSEVNEFSLGRVSTFDEAGLLTSVQARTGLVTQFTYDVLGRRLTRQMPARDFADESGTETAPADNVISTYGALGLTETHTNRHGVIQRWFNADGSLRKQTWRPNKTGGAAGNWTDEVEYTYDETGARLSLRHNSDLISYGYGPTTGDLDSIVVRFAADNRDRVFKFAWDGLGRRKQVTYPISIEGQPMRVSFTYDAGGTWRKLESTHTRSDGTPNYLKVTLRNTVVDALGRAVTQQCLHISTLELRSPCAAGGTVDHRYSKQAWLVRQGADSTTYDASGNVRWMKQGATTTSFSMLPGSHRLSLGGTRLFEYDADGARVREAAGGATQYRYWYDALGRTTGSWGNPSPNAYGADACRYDPLDVMAKPCENGAFWLAMDGVNVAGAVAPGGNSNQNPVWSFVHGPGVDDPLIGIHNRGGGSPQFQIFYWVTDGHGRQITVADSLGYYTPGYDNEIQTQSGVYAGGTSKGTSFGASRFDGGATAAGKSFFRNRLYDQATGRWTQEDPIGVAGGINLYQFNGNNPVMFTDPFGLDPYVNCRPVGGKGGSGVVAHCAIRVKDDARKLDVTIELIPKGSKKEIYWTGPNSSNTQAYDASKWAKVATPDGMSSQEFDDAVLKAAGVETVKQRGTPYSFGGSSNSNNFVHEVITGAGGTVPATATAGFLLGAPGLCGGSGLSTGSECR